jgi:histidine ammonia-lyase
MRPPSNGPEGFPARTLRVMPRSSTRARSVRSSPRPEPIELAPQPLSLHEVAAAARQGAAVRVHPDALEATRRSRAVVERAVKSGEARYGLNTGFGSLAKQRIGPGDLRTLQRNLIRSHSAGVGEPLRIELVRAMMLVLAGSLARGLSGVRPVVVQTLAAMLNKRLTPVVPSVGSVGASGDLAPLAAVALALTGEGEVFEGDGDTATLKRRPAGAAMRAKGIRPLTLEAKEGLALINGTHLMCAEAALLCGDADRLLHAATTALAMSIDACRASHAFLDSRLYAARQHMALGVVAMNLRTLLTGGQIAASHLDNDPRVQDPYSLRAGPTVLGAVSDLIASVETTIETELGAVTDNPLVFTGQNDYGIEPRAEGDGDEQLMLHTHLDGEGRVEVDAQELMDALPRMTFGTDAVGPAVLSGANFHGMPVAIPLDCLAIGLCHLAGISERRTYLITGAFEPESHLKPFLAPRPGLQSGLMIAQYTAAACVNEMIGLANPASVANISTCAGMEDYNSFGPRSAAKARRSLELAQRVVAIELLCAAQALEHHRPLRSGVGVERAYRAIRKVVRPLRDDRPLTADIEAVAGLVRDGIFAID